ncbi:MAG: ester cyclase [Chloroflexi bacterium]|nr:ester cyclase [Chloroflexota bacterium]
MRKFYQCLTAAAVLLAAPVLGACQPSAQPMTAPVPTDVPGAAMLKAQAEQAAQNKEVMHRFIAMFETGKWQDFPQVIAADCVLHHPGGEDVVGLEAMVANWKVAFGPLKDMKVTPHAEISEGNTLMEFYTFEATYDGEFMGRQLSAVPIKFNQVEMVRIANGKIVEWWVEQDRLWMVQQLGMKLQW